MRYVCKNPPGGGGGGERNPYQLIDYLPRSSKSCDCVTFRVLKYLLSTFPLYTPHCHMILSKQKCCLLLTGVSTESQKRTSLLQTKRAFFSNKKYDSYKCLTCAELCEAFTFLMENIYVCNLKACVNIKYL